MKLILKRGRHSIRQAYKWKKMVKGRTTRLARRNSNCHVARVERTTTSIQRKVSSTFSHGSSTSLISPKKMCTTRPVKMCSSTSFISSIVWFSFGPWASAQVSHSSLSMVDCHGQINQKSHLTASVKNTPFRLIKWQTIAKNTRSVLSWSCMS